MSAPENFCFPFDARSLYVPALLDLTGQEFGRYVVIGYDRSGGRKSRRGPRWLCRCNCGAVRSVCGTELRESKTKSCGCYRREQMLERRRRRFKDITGRRFGRLLVVGFAGMSAAGNGAQWRCRCECGQAKIFLGSNLRYGRTQSCGCLQRERSRIRNVAAHELLRAYLTKHE
jgi:hypothetical protein